MSQFLYLQWAKIFLYLVIDANECRLSAPCKNGATCAATGVNTYTCTCAAGYTGTNCDQGKLFHPIYLHKRLIYKFNTSKYIFIYITPSATKRYFTKWKNYVI